MRKAKNKRAHDTMWWDESPDWFWLKAVLRGGVVVRIVAQSAGMLANAADPRELSRFLCEEADLSESGLEPRIARAVAFAIPYVVSVDRTALFRAYGSSRGLRVALRRRKLKAELGTDGRVVVVAPGSFGLEEASAIADLLESAGPKRLAESARFRSNAPGGNNPAGRSGTPRTFFMNDESEWMRLRKGSQPLARRQMIAVEWLRQYPVPDAYDDNDGSRECSYWSRAVAMAAKTHDLNSWWHKLCDACGMRIASMESALKAFADDVCAWQRTHAG